VNLGNKKIFVWLITWAGLLVLVLYSPIGSPALYESNKYDVEFRGVDFGGAIQNAPTIRPTGSKNNNANFNLPSYADVERRTSNYSLPPASSGFGESANYSAGALGSTQTATNNTSSGVNSGVGALGTVSSIMEIRELQFILYSNRNDVIVD
jgi:hypothetical protein